MSRLFFIFILLFSTSYALQPNPETLEIRLATEEQLIPLYLTGGDRSPYYNVLAFDLSNNGTTTLAPKTAEREELSQKNLSKAWNRQGIYYVVKLITTSDEVSAKLWDVNERVEVQFGPLKASRHAVHEIADAIHKKITGFDGIATTKIIFAEMQETKGDIWVVDYDGANVKKVTNQNALCVNPHFIAPSQGARSKDFFYVSYKQGQPKIFHSSLSSGNGKRVLTLRGNQIMPALDRSRSQLALISDASGNPDLFIVDFNAHEGVVGKPRQAYAVPYATQATPTFSPDGSQIAFVSNKDGRPKIYLIDIPREGASIKEIKAKLLVKRSWACTAPCWSPDGSKISYTSKVDGVRQIFSYNLQTKENVQLTKGAGDKENPTWAPNSLHLCYNESSGPYCNLFILNTRQLKPQQITFGSNEKKYPSWEPR